jgi:hypothetical protein
MHRHSTQLPSLHLGGVVIPVLGTVGDGGRITFAREARLWLRYIDGPADAAPTSGADGRLSTNGGAA